MRSTGSPATNSERTTRITPIKRQARAEQHREIARPHLAGGAERIAARRQQRHRREGDEHHAGPEILGARILVMVPALRTGMTRGAIQRLLLP